MPPLLRTTLALAQDASPLASWNDGPPKQSIIDFVRTAGVHGAGGGSRLMMLLLHDDARREYAYGPAQGLPDTKVGTFTQALYDEAKRDGWTIISMKNDWKRIFAFE
jgi:hypothetical protein